MYKKSLAVFFSIIIFCMGCSGSRMSSIKNKEPEVKLASNQIRLLVDENISEKEIIIDIPSYIYIEGKKAILVKPGDIVHFMVGSGNVYLKIGDKFLEADNFQLFPKDTTQFLTYNGLRFRGNLKIINSSDSIAVVNTIDLESYLKGVIPKEMPLGKGEEYFEALKAFAICARTYSLNRMKRNGDNFDVFVDTRDQVYGGVDAEKEISNRAVDETKGLVLTYDRKIATVFYHSTCGGRTEKVQNVFAVDSIPYLQGVEDGYPPYCSISPSFNWTETYPEDLFIDRLRNAGLIDSEFYRISEIEVVIRFESGRVNELKIDLVSSTDKNKSISIFGNNIRSIIRTANNKSILKSNWFDINLDENKNVTITGKGYGHGVGFCQWGAINQSKLGYGYKKILFHYFPGTKISYLND